MKRLLAATDFSDASARALERAASLAQARGCELRILHVAPKGTSESELARLKARIEEAAASSPALRRLQVELAVLTGAADKEIAGEALAWGADLIVIGGHGPMRVRDALFGTTATQLLRETRVPMLISRCPADRRYRRVLAGIDATTAAEEVLRVAASVSGSGELFAVHAFHVPFEGLIGEEAVHEDVENDHVTAIRALVERVLPTRTGRKVQIHVKEGDALPVLSRAIDELHPDLLVLASHIRGPVSRLLTGSVSELAISSLEIDLLILKTKAEDSITSL